MRHEVVRKSRHAHITHGYSLYGVQIILKKLVKS